ncbi:hypothetical protein CHS0354_011012 [Potamilus streckersoni]|uniref:Uncharacterized protein n=1 Tax=Potamilus streckersoni TaxID=2493646 RepID=A0AAE0TNM7_9BIVA|nr:hypothetical protein CHS0354_011012 [Potamilus streckersoni]
MMGSGETKNVWNQSPPGMLHISDGFDLYKAAGQELSINSGSMFEVRYDQPTNKTSPRDKDTDEASNPSSSANNKRPIPETRRQSVHWVDEDLNKPLALDIDVHKRERSDSVSSSGEPKPILKPRVNCVVIVSKN